MKRSPSVVLNMLLTLLLAACGAMAPTLRAAPEEVEVESTWEEARADPSCVLFLCSEEERACALVRCAALEEAEPEVAETAAPHIVLARGPLILRPPSFAPPSRWWGQPLGAPRLTEPVFEIPWHNWREREQRRLHIKDFCFAPREPLEKHHVFPQAPDLAAWFREQGINIHAYTIPLRKSFHARLHSGGPRGGQWNEAWRQFQKQNEGATREEMMQFALELMARFGVHGEFVHYCH